MGLRPDAGWHVHPGQLRHLHQDGLLADAQATGVQALRDQVRERVRHQRDRRIHPSAAHRPGHPELRGDRRRAVGGLDLQHPSRRLHHRAGRDPRCHPQADPEGQEPRRLERLCRPLWHPGAGRCELENRHRCPQATGQGQNRHPGRSRRYPAIPVSRPADVRRAEPAGVRSVQLAWGRRLHVVRPGEPGPRQRVRKAAGTGQEGPQQARAGLRRRVHRRLARYAPRDRRAVRPHQPGGNQARQCLLRRTAG
ncbi:hypothetical protein D3C81_1342470 [compost metagenome]